MKNYYLIIALIFPVFISAQTQKIDPAAVLILDQMSDLIGELESCTFNVSNSQDVNDPDYGLIKINNQSSIIFNGPNKMLVHLDGDKGKRGYWYNGEHVVFYSYSENNYAIIDAPHNNIIETIDDLHADYGIDIPSADFFYPSFTDDILESFDTLKYLGEKTIDDQDCFHLKASNKNMDVQFWISNDAYKLPKKFVIIYKDKNMQYEATYSDWVLNPTIPDAAFEFTPPAKAAQINILAKN